jgi:hypothetical protein
MVLLNKNHCCYCQDGEEAEVEGGEESEILQGFALDV